MDSKFLRVTLLISVLFMITIFFVVLYSNGMGPGQKEEKKQTQVEVVQEQILSGQIGNDLYGWMEDDTFFDEEKIKVVEEEGIVKVTLLATSIEKDMRIRIVGNDGNLIEGQFFEIKINETDSYKDLDRDGIIYVPELKAGEYQVSLEERTGYAVPATAIPVVVKDRVEYKEIDDISLLIKTEETVDVMAEDADQITDLSSETGTSEPTELRKDTEAGLGIDVSRWNEEINWTKVKDKGIEYAIIRAGYRGNVTGTLVEDKYFKRNVEEALKAGIPIGLYVTSKATTEVEAVEEASMVLALCKEYDITYPIFIHVPDGDENDRTGELDKKLRTRICQAFCETIRKGGYKAGIHSDKNGFEKRLDMNILTDDIYVWLAEYGDAITYDEKYHMWQYTSSGRVIGIEGRVNLNLSFLEP